MPSCGRTVTTVLFRTVLSRTIGCVSLFSVECKGELEYLADVLLYTGETWPLDILDAIGRPQPGLRFSSTNLYSVVQSWMGTVLAEMSSRIALTRHLGMKAIF